DVAAERGDVGSHIALGHGRLGARKAAVDRHPRVQVEGDGAVGAAGRRIGSLGHQDLVAEVGGGQGALQVGVGVGPAAAVVGARGLLVDEQHLLLVGAHVGRAAGRPGVAVQVGGGGAAAGAGADGGRAVLQAQVAERGIDKQGVGIDVVGAAAGPA